MRRNPTWTLIGVMVTAVAVTVLGCGETSTPQDDRATAAQTATSESGPVEILATLEPAQALVAQPVRLTVTAEAPRGVDVRLPEPPQQLGTLQVLDVASRPAVPVEDGRAWTQVYTLESLDTGEIAIPSFALGFVDRRDDEPAMGEARTPTLSLQVHSVLEADADPRAFRDIKGTVALPEADGHTPRGAWWLFAVAGGAVVLLAIVGLALWRRRTTSEPPREQALRELERLSREPATTDEQLQRVYYRLTDTVRLYVERQFGFNARTRTSREFLDDVHHTGTLPQPHQHRLDELLQNADLVKYARFNPGESIARNAIATAREFVEQTSRQPEEAKS